MNKEELAKNENTIVTVHNPFISGGTFEGFAENGDYSVMWDGVIIGVIPSQGTLNLRKPMADHAAKYLVNRLIIENEKVTVVDERTQQLKETNGFPKIHDQPLRDKYMAQILGDEKSQAVPEKKTAGEEERQKTLSLNTESEVNLNADDMESRRLELEDLNTDALKSLAVKLEIDASRIKRKSDLVEVILEKEYQS